MYRAIKNAADRRSYIPSIQFISLIKTLINCENKYEWRKNKLNIFKIY